jgi:hypothetical protein
VDVYSDDEDEGRCWEGATTADGAGVFTFVGAMRLAGPNVTATTTDAAGSTSAFATPKVVPHIPRRHLRRN